MQYKEFQIQKYIKGKIPGWQKSSSGFFCKMLHRKSQMNFLAYPIKAKSLSFKETKLIVLVGEKKNYIHTSVCIHVLCSESLIVFVSAHSK